MSVGKMKTGCCFLAFLLFLLQAQTALAQLYSVTDLGDLPGGSDSSEAFAISNLGTVVGRSIGTADADYTQCGAGSGALKPFIWTLAVGIQTLGPTPTLNIFTNPLKPCGGGALGTNDQGEVVGYLDYGFAGGTRGFIWSAGNGMQLIDPQRAQGATDINNGGQVVGPTGGGAYRWSEAGGFEGLFGSGTVPWAAAINNLGVTVGVLQGGRYSPVFWDAAGTLRFMNGIPDDNLSSETRSLMGINDLGEIVGRVCNSPTSPLFRADGCDGFFWSPITGAQNLGELPTSGSHYTGGFGINSGSQVVGFSNGRVFLWTASGGIRDLNSLLDQSGAGWTLISANAINDSGQIVGYGDHNGLTRAFLLTPVPTATPVLAVSPSALDFSGVNVGSSKDLSFTVQNTGGGTLTGSASTSAPFSIVGNNSFNLAANETQDLTVRFSPTSAATFNGNVSFTSNAGDASPTVTGTGVLLDTDGDGMPDQWEILYGLNPNDPTDADLDPDGDGITNYFEYVLGTSPLSRFTVGTLIPDAVIKTANEPIYGTCPAKSAQANKLVVIIHGWNSYGIKKPDRSPADNWVANMADKIRSAITNNGAAAEWDVCTYDWESDAAQFNPNTAWTNAGKHGQKLGYELFRRGYNYVHFVAHSAGSNLLQTAIEEIISEYESLHTGFTSSCNAVPLPDDCLLPKPTFHSTFLDAYIAESIFHPARARKYAIDRYGLNALWAEHYVDLKTLGDDTDTFLSKAINFDVSDLDPDADTVLGLDSIHNHIWPHVWYELTINSSDGPDYASKMGFGFPMSREDGGDLPSHDKAAGIQHYFRRGDDCNLKTEASTCGQDVPIPPPSIGTKFVLDTSIGFLSSQAANQLAVSDTGTVAFPSAIAATLTTGSPVWLSVGVNTSRLINSLQLDYRFLSGHKGFLSIFFDGKLIRELDQQFVSLGTNVSSKIWLGEVLPGQHVFSLRLDAFDATQAIIEISNVQTDLMELVTNTLPLASAGPNQTVRLGSLVTLNGGGSSDPDNGPGPLNFAWTKISGPAVTLSGATTPNPAFTPKVAGTYTFSLVVNDGQDIGGQRAGERDDYGSSAGRYQRRW